MASNIGGTATLIGDPPNIIIASRAGLTFNDFLVHLAPIVVVLVVVFVGAVPGACSGRAFRYDPERAAEVMALRRARGDPRPAAAGPVRWSCSALVAGRLRRCTRCSHSSRRSSRCSAPALLVAISRLDAERRASPRSSGRPWSSSWACSSWSAAWSRPASSSTRRHRPSPTPSATTTARRRPALLFGLRGAVRRSSTTSPTSPPWPRSSRTSSTPAADPATGQVAVVGAGPRRRPRRQRHRRRRQRQRRRRSASPRATATRSPSGSSPATASSSTVAHRASWRGLYVWLRYF